MFIPFKLNIAVDAAEHVGLRQVLCPKFEKLGCSYEMFWGQMRDPPALTTVTSICIQFDDVSDDEE
jgi:hypothetical protein